MAQEHIQEIVTTDDETVIPPLPEAETDDLGSAIIVEETDTDAAVDERLAAEDEHLREEMAEADEDAADEAEDEA